MDAKLVKPHTVPGCCISSTVPAGYHDPKPLTVGKTYTAISYTYGEGGKESGQIERLELYIGRRWYNVPADKFEFDDPRTVDGPDDPGPVGSQYQEPQIRYAYDAYGNCAPAYNEREPEDMGFGEQFYQD